MAVIGEVSAGLNETTAGTTETTAAGATAVQYSTGLSVEDKMNRMLCIYWDSTVPSSTVHHRYSTVLVVPVRVLQYSTGTGSRTVQYRLVQYITGTALY